MQLKRKDALNVIRVDAAQHGRATKVGLTAYLEARVSRAAFEKAVRDGQAIYERGEKRE